MGNHVSSDVPAIDSNAQFGNVERVEGFLGVRAEGSR